MSSAQVLTTGAAELMSGSSSAGFRVQWQHAVWEDTLHGDSHRHWCRTCLRCALRKKANKIAYDSLFGLGLAIVSWLVNAQTFFGGLTVDSTGADYPVLFGNLVAIIGSIIIVPHQPAPPHFTTHPFGPTPFDSVTSYPFIQAHRTYLATPLLFQPAP
ncbi:hypothetical protein CF319_g8725 [Tilletia indica]|nr:hypothetical protein CF319_g8725 [Tilletia indica]